MKTKQGFTLVELLVVIFIIGILLTTVVVSYRSAMIRNRDETRAGHTESLRLAVIMYADKKQEFPLGGNGDCGGSLSAVEIKGADTKNCFQEELQDFLPHFDQYHDPFYPGYSGSVYTYELDGDDCRISYCNEKDSREKQVDCRTGEVSDGGVCLHNDQLDSIHGTEAIN
jgi:prepilin-type N-terminal cleavage/methylation domain-containing protein